ncbi:MAG TPA: hypothetical protein VGH07_04700 [Chthoniobacterales bacterium]
MKRLVAGGLLFLFVAIGLFILWERGAESLLPSQIAPAECLVYVELPKIDRMSKRWPDTALSQMLEEPSVQQFLKKPVSKIPANWQEAGRAFARLRCGALFFGMTEPGLNSWICGFQANTDASTAQREIGDISKALFGVASKQIRPGELEQSGGVPPVFGQPLCTQIGSWTLLSRSIELLKEAARNSRVKSVGLQSQERFRKCRANVPSDYDALTFVQGEPSFDSFTDFHWQYRGSDISKNSRAVLAVTTIEGARLRDTVFTLGVPPAATGPLDRQGLSMTSASTIGYLAAHVGLSEIWKWCSRFAEESALAELIRDYMGQAKSFGIDPEDLDKLISGAEIIIDRGSTPDSLTAAFSLQVVDPAKFQHLMDQVVAAKFPDNCNRLEIASIPAYLIHVNRSASIVFGLADRHLLVSGSESKFADLVNRLRMRAPGLETDDQFKSVSKLVNDPDDLFLYFDVKAFFEQVYGASRPMLALGLGMIPVVSRYVDGMALPETSSISKHLSPVVLSRRRVTEGVVDESAGPITAYDAAALISGGALAMRLLAR